MPIKVRVQAVPDETSFNRTANHAERRFSEAGRDSGRAFAKGLEDAAEKADPKVLAKWEKAYDKVADSATRVKAAESKLKELREGSASEARLVAQAGALERARRAEISATRDAARAYRELDEAVNSTGFRGAVRSAIGIGRDTADNFASGFAGASSLTRIFSAAGPAGIAVAGIAAVGFMAGKGFVSQLEAGMATMSMKDTFAARIGADSGVMQRYGAAAGKAFADSWGASVEDNLNVVQFALQGGLIDPDATEADIQTAIGQLQTVAQVTGDSAQSISRGVRNMIRTGLVGSTEEALDLLVTASQRGLNISGDLLDTFEEYGTKFRDIGLSGADALGLINQMWIAGIRNTDVAADALKEFSIRVVDGSKTTTEAFAALGFNAGQMAEKFAAGGSTARTAFGEVLTAIRNIHDPLQQELVGVALFGTKWEDAGDAIKGADLDAAASQLGNIEGATKRASDKVSEHADQWDALKKKIDNTFSGLREWLADSVIGRFFDQTLPRAIGSLFDEPGITPGYTNTYPGQRRTPAMPGADGAITPSETGAIRGDGTFLPNLITGNPGQVAPPGLAGGGPAGTPSDRIAPVPMTPGGAGGGGGGSISLPYPAEYGGPMLAGETDQQYQARMANIAAEHSLVEAQARVNQLRQTANVDASQIVAAENAVIDARMRVQSTQRGYVDSLTAKAGGGPVALYDERYAQGPRPGQTASQFSAESSYFEAQQKTAQATADYQSMMASGTATATELALAHNKVVEAQRNENKASLSLSESYKKTTEQLGQIGAQLDADFGASNGLPGIAENLTRFIANLAFAPVLGALSGVQSAAGGYDAQKQGAGLVGLVASAMSPAVVESAPTFTGGTPRVITAPSSARPTATAAIPSGGSPSGYMGDAALLSRIPRGGRYESSIADLTQGLGDCTSGIEDLVNIIDGRPTAGRSMATGNADEWLTSRGFIPTSVPMPGTFQVGFNAGHMEATLPGGTNVNYGSDASVASGGTVGAEGAWGSGFTSHYYRPVGATAVAQPNSLGSLGSIPLPLPVTIVGGGLPSIGGRPSGSSGTPIPGSTPITPGAPTTVGGIAAAGGMTPEQLTSPGLTGGPTTVGGIAPTAGPGGAGFGGLGGLPMAGLQAAAASLDAIAPGASIAANMGIQLSNRAIAQMGKVAGIGVGGLLETFSLADSPLSDPSASWFGRLAAGFAGAKPALPNMAGGSAAAPNGTQHGTAQGAAPGPGGITVNYTNNQATEDRAGKDLTNHLTAMYAGPGW